MSMRRRHRQVRKVLKYPGLNLGGRHDGSGRNDGGGLLLLLLRHLSIELHGSESHLINQRLCR
jgi:hypothetical protein